MEWSQKISTHVVAIKVGTWLGEVYLKERQADITIIPKLEGERVVQVVISHPVAWHQNVAVTNFNSHAWHPKVLRTFFFPRDTLYNQNPRG